MKFDVIDKKPKLYVLIPLTAFVLAALLLLVKFFGNEGSLCANLVLEAYYIAVIFFLIKALINQLGYNPYSYNTAYYIGFSAFIVILLAENVYVLRVWFNHGGTISVEQLTASLLSSSVTFMSMTFPALAIFSVALIISNITLLKKEGVRFVNFLAIILAVFLMAGEAAVFFVREQYAGTVLSGNIVKDLTVNTLAAIFVYLECMLIGVFTAGILVAKYEPEFNKDYIIILGCGIKKDGTPTPLLKSRIDRAIKFAAEQKKETGKEPVFVPSGGKGSDEAVSEAACMKNYLLSQGVKEEQIITEDKSATTYENMKFSKELLDGINPEAVIAFSTSNYHVFRAGLKARRVKMRALGMGAETKWYFWPNAGVREFLGLLVEHRGKQALILLGMIAAYVLLTLYAYNIIL